LLRGLAVLLALVTLLAVAGEVYLQSRARAHWRGMEVAAERELLGGGLQGLLRARAMALGGAAIADDEEAAATVALASAILASDYGLDETNAALTAADAIDAEPDASPRAQSLKLASRALVELVAHQPARAEALAHQSISQGHRQASPLFALGRARFLQGDLAAAGSAFKAALVREPGFVEARAAWAEVWLESGERERARDALLAVLRRTPDHGRAGLLLAELGTGQEWESICARDEAASPVIAAGCDLARAEQAWRRGDRAAALRFGEAAGRRRPVDPRVLGRDAQLLASLGAVDLASACLDEAIRIASPNLPSLRWARVAVELGRGQLANPPDDLPITSSPRAPAYLSRIALASGGIKALAAALPELPRTSRGMAVLAALVEGEDGKAAGGEPPAGGPANAYVQGLRARLAGKTALAAELLLGALHGHADACRAAGEYLAVCRELGRVPEAAAFAVLAGENSRCVNLPAALAAAHSRRRRPGTIRRSSATVRTSWQ
jgi:tetratricopeptide (TPR) repeat protein